MSQQVRVSRNLVFQGAADDTRNVEGNINFDKAVKFDDFLNADIDDTFDYNFDQVNSGTLSVTAPHCATLTTGAADDDDAELAVTALVLDRDTNPVFEARVRNDDVENLAMFIGFTDSQTETTDTLAFTYADDSLTSTATDAAGFLMDSDKGTTDTSILCVSVNDDTDGTEIDSGTDAADSTFYVLRVELDSSGNATYYLNGAAVGYEAEAVADVALCAYIGVINREGASNTLDIDYVKVWCDEA